MLALLGYLVLGTTTLLLATLGALYLYISAGAARRRAAFLRSARLPPLPPVPIHPIRGQLDIFKGPLNADGHPEGWKRLWLLTHEKKEKVLRVQAGPSFVQAYLWVIADPKVLEHIFNDHVSSIGTNATLAHVFGAIGSRSMIALPDGEDWKQHRNVVSQWFRPHQLSLASDVSVHYSHKLADAIEAELTKTPDGCIDFVNWANRVTADIIAHIAFGVDIGAVDGNAGGLVMAFRNILHETNRRAFTVLPWHKVLPHPASYKEGTQFANQFIESIVERRLTELNGAVPDREDLIDIFLRAERDGKLPRKDVIDEGKTFCLGGFETTSHTISNLLYYLSRAPEIQDRLVAELTPIFTKTKSPSVEDLGQAVYLGACISEVLRISPVGNATARTMRDDLVVAGPEGFVIPKGANIIPSILAMHRDPALWGPDALEFRPERWLNEDTLPTRTVSSFSYLPFGLGLRSCVGKKLALTELRATIATIVWRLRLSDSGRPMKITSVAGMGPAECWVKLAPRPGSK